MTYLAISIGAIVGANLRYFLGGWIGEHMAAGFPWGTLVINVTGSFVIGVVLGLAAERTVPGWWRPGLAVGFLGSYTTFSTFSYETINLIRDGSYLAALANAGGGLVVSLVAVFAGLAITRAL